MRAYYINLANRPERRAAMQARLEALSMDFERVDAVTPQDITAAQRARYCNPSAHHWQSPVELCCSLSHARAMHQFLTSPASHALIFEDDAILSPSLPTLVAEFERESFDVDILRLETDNSRLRLLPKPEARLGAFAIYRLFTPGGGAAGYLVSRTAAERITAGEEILFNPTDQALFKPSAPISLDLVVRQLVPAICIQEDRFGQVAARLDSSDLERPRKQRDTTDHANFWRRSGFNLADFIQRDILGATHLWWLKQTRGVMKREVPFKTD